MKDPADIFANKIFMTEVDLVHQSCVKYNEHREKTEGTSLNLEDLLEAMFLKAYA